MFPLKNNIIKIVLKFDYYQSHFNTIDREMHLGEITRLLFLY